MEIKKCPSCGKTVLATAKICKHCGKLFEENPVREAVPEPVIREPEPAARPAAPQPAPSPQPARPAFSPSSGSQSPRSEVKIPQKTIVALLAAVVLVAVAFGLIKSFNRSPEAMPAVEEEEQVPITEAIPPRVVEEEEQVPVTESKPATTAVESGADRNKTAYIKGKDVTIRESHTTSSNRLGYFDDRETVLILDEYSPSNSDEAIAAKVIKLYNSSGNNTYTLPKGKAVKIIGSAGGKYEVSFSHSQYGTLHATVYAADLEFIAGNKWYKVRRKNGDTGWVYSKFITAGQ